tara:strand:- start:3394 stop:3714 length:321 start_codon:yes stop_codon:yes gene_type:complete
MKGRTPNKEERKWMDLIASLGCIVCRLFYGCNSPAEIHHIDGKTKKEAHLNTIPLCYKHHREGINNCTCVSRHPFKTEFERRYGKESQLLQKTKEIIKELQNAGEI